MFKPGTKFIIEVETIYQAMANQTTVPVKPTLNNLYRMKGFGSLVFDEWGLRNLERYNMEDGPFGIGCILRIRRPKPKDRAEMQEWIKLGWPETYPEHNPMFMVTTVDKNEDGTWTYQGVSETGEQVKVSGNERLTYLGLHFNTVMEWSKYISEKAKEKK